MTAVTKTKTTFITRSKRFGQLTKWAFQIVDKDGTGQVGRAELYSGILLVHLNLAKYAGAAACYPPTREVIDELFDACDDDNSGYIDEKEFVQIMVICCAQISSRLAVYFLIIILLVPYVAEAVINGMLHLDDWFDLHMREKAHAASWVENFLTFGDMAEKIVSTALFFLVVPLFFNYIDRSSGRAAQSFVIDTSDEGKDD